MKNKGMVSKKVLIMAGGTGGHVFPGLAVANELAARGFQVEWLGTEKGIESQLVPQANIPLNIIAIEGVRGRGLKGLLLAPLKIIRAIFAVRSLFKQIQPDLVIGFGGYVSGPGGFTAWLSGIPFFIHEQNAIAGTTNVILAKFAKQIFTAFPNVFAQGKWVGNPVRKEIEQIRAPQDRFDTELKTVNLLVLGGSRGAQAINELIPESLAKLQTLAGVGDIDIRVRHQAGKGKDEATEKCYQQWGVTADVSAFIDDMVAAYNWAHLVVCRSGALTVSELSAVGVGSILIPFPFAIDDHQTANAQFLVEENAAILKQQRDLDALGLAKNIHELVSKPGRLLSMAVSARNRKKENAAAVLVDSCEEILNV